MLASASPVRLEFFLTERAILQPIYTLFTTGFLLTNLYQGA